MSTYGEGSYGVGNFGAFGGTIELPPPPFGVDLFPRCSLGNIGIVRGDTCKVDISVLRNRVPEDISGDHLSFTAKLSTEHPDAQAVITKSTSTGGIEIVSGPGGLAQLIIDPFDTLSLPGLRPTILIYDLQIVKGISGEVFTIDQGSVVVQPDVAIAVA